MGIVNSPAIDGVPVKLFLVDLVTPRILDRSAELVAERIHDLVHRFIRKVQVGARRGTALRVDLVNHLFASV